VGLGKDGDDRGCGWAKKIDHDRSLSPSQARRVVTWWDGRGGGEGPGEGESDSPSWDVNVRMNDNRRQRKSPGGASSPDLISATLASPHSVDHTHPEAERDT
jgi:hypothetical protein